MIDDLAEKLKRIVIYWQQCVTKVRLRKKELNPRPVRAPGHEHADQRDSGKNVEKYTTAEWESGRKAICQTHLKIIKI